MQEIFAHFPPPSDLPALTGGQIFTADSPESASLIQPALKPAMARIALTALQEKSLEALFLFKQATADILLRYLHIRSLRYLQKQLAALHPKEEKDRFIEYLYIPKPHESRYSSSRFGSSPTIYTLGRRGHLYLKQKGFPVGRYRHPVAGVKEEIPLRHRMAVNEFLLKALLLVEEFSQDLQLLKHLHEQYWNGNPLKVQKPREEKPKGLSPDLLLAFRSYNPRNQYWFPVEINLSREWEKDWIAKVELYRYCIPAYKERLGTDILTTIPVVVASPAAFPRMLYGTEPSEQHQREATERQRRMELLKTWTEETLERLRMRREADLFSFTCAPLDELSPTELFFGTHWYIPFSDTPRPLLKLRKAGGA